MADGNGNNGGLEFLYNHLLNELCSERERNSRVDNKLNFILVFLGTLIISTQFLIPNADCQNDKRVALIIIIVLMYVAIILDLVIVFYGMGYRKGKLSIDLDMFNEDVIKQYKESSSIDAYENHILEIKDCVKSYNSYNEKKIDIANRAITVAFITTIFMAVALIIMIAWR